MEDELRRIILTRVIGQTHHWAYTQRRTTITESWSLRTGRVGHDILEVAAQDTPKFVARAEKNKACPMVNRSQYSSVSGRVVDSTRMVGNGAMQWQVPDKRRSKSAEP